MAKIVWREQMNVGIADIDRDHRTVLECVNMLDEAVTARHFDPHLVMTALKQLRSYVETHFAREEKLMEAVGFPQLRQHREWHAAARYELDRVGRAFLAFPVKDTAEQVHHFASSWLIKHVIQSDHEILPYLQRAQVR